MKEKDMLKRITNAYSKEEVDNKINSIPNVTTEKDGLMSKEDKAFLLNANGKIGSTFRFNPIYNTNHDIIIKLAEKGSRCMITIKLFGNSYSQYGSPILNHYEFYDFTEGNLMNLNGISISYPFNLYVFHSKGDLYCCVKRSEMKLYQTYNFEITYSNQIRTPEMISHTTFMDDMEDVENLKIIIPETVSLNSSLSLQKEIDEELLLLEKEYLING